MTLMEDTEVNSTDSSGKYFNVKPDITYHSGIHRGLLGVKPDTTYPSGIHHVLVVVPIWPTQNPMISEYAMSDNAKRFRAFVKQWTADTLFVSSAAHMAEHPAYKSIIAMGKPAIPLLLGELDRSPDHWFIALQQVTHEDPVPEESRGIVSKMAEAWLKWGREQGYY